MHYTLQDGAERKKRRKFVVFLGLLLLLGGLYLLYNTISPALPIFDDAQATTKKLKTQSPVVGENRLYMPQINVDIPVVELQPGEAESKALDRGALHRVPENGNPKDGGNYVLAAHRFTLGLTPAQTRAQSPFYHIDQMKVGDEVYVDYSGVRYAYKITATKTVAPSDVAIEDKTSDAQLTVYSCTLSGANDGRVVLFAKQTGTVTWDSGQPKLQANN